MRKLFCASSLLFLLTACTHNIYLVSRRSGDIAKGDIVTIPGQHSGDMSIVLKNKTYNGRWVYMENGGAIGFGAANAFSGTHSAYGTSTVAMQSTDGGGTILASASDGSRLRCSFSYNSWGKTGVGICSLNSGEQYDLQIN